MLKAATSTISVRHDEVDDLLELEREEEVAVHLHPVAGPERRAERGLDAARHLLARRRCRSTRISTPVIAVADARRTSARRRGHVERGRCRSRTCRSRRCRRARSASLRGSCRPATGVPSGETTLTGSPSATPSCRASSCAEDDARERRPCRPPPPARVVHRAAGTASAAEAAAREVRASSRRPRPPPAGRSPRTTTPETLCPLLSIDLAVDERRRRHDARHVTSPSRDLVGIVLIVPA